MLHSAYNPEKEAAAFVANLKADFKPACVLIIEPALSYCVESLRKRFPEAELCCIRLCSYFSAYDAPWDFVFHWEQNVQSLTEQLYSHFGEEKLCALQAYSWTASAHLFSSECQNAWEAIKQAVIKSRNVLYTRSFFAKRWLKNCIQLSKHIETPATLTQGSCPIVVAASGTSLKGSLPFLKAHRSSFFLIAVSSALEPLLFAGIKPDLVMSTDGGYWAKKHLEPLRRQKDIPLALAAEGACAAEVLAANPIVPLAYTDSFAVPLLTQKKIPFMYALRNGTVSGTAAFFALALTTGKVFVCGLDLAGASGYQHTQPNALEARSAQRDNRTHPLATRLTKSQMQTESLRIYRDWFIFHSGEVKERLYRLSADFAYEQPLGEIQDVNWSFFSKQIPKKSTFPSCKLIAYKKTESQTEKNALLKEFASARWESEFFPLETILLKRAQTQEEAQAMQSTIDQEKKALLQQLFYWESERR